MKYYKNNQNQIFAFESDDEMQKYAKEPLSLITDKEKDQILAPTPEQLAEQRISELQQKLRDTDYVGLQDYDKDKPEIIAQRQAWRDEIRQLEATLNDD